MECLPIVALSSFVRKRGRDFVQRVARETAAGQTPQELRRDGSTLDQRPDPSELRLQTGDGRFGRLGRDQPPPQVGADRRIAVAAAREELSPAFGQASVVDDSGAFERPDRLLPR